MAVSISWLLYFIYLAGADLVITFKYGLCGECNRRWGDGNGHSHIRAALLGPSLSVPVTDGHLVLGTWQQIIFIDLDNRARSRELVVQMVGE